MTPALMIPSYACALLCAPVFATPILQSVPAQEEDEYETRVVQVDDMEQHSVSLDEAMTLAEINNITLSIEDYATEVARFNALGSLGAFDWVLGGNLRYTDFERKPAQAIFGDFLQEGDQMYWDVSLVRPLETGGSFEALFTSNRTTTTSSNAVFPKLYEDEARINFNQPLLRGAGVDRATSDQQEAEVLYEQQVERRRMVLQILLRDTSNAYWDLVQTRNQFGVAESSLSLGEEQLERNSRLLAAGVGTEVEVIQAEAEVARRKEARLGADVAQRIAADALKVLIYGAQEDPEGWDAMLVPSTESPVDVSVDNVPKWVDAFDVAMKMRPDVRMQDQDVRLAEIRHDRSISDRRIGLDFSLSVQSQGLDTTWERAGNEALEFENLSYTAGLALNAPIQNRTAANAEMAADRRHKSSLRSREQLRIQVISEIRDAVRQMHYQSLAVSAAATSLRAADRQLAAEQARYENDLSTNFQVLEFQMQFVEAMNNEQTARTNFAKARFQLQVAQGILGGKP